MKLPIMLDEDQVDAMQIREANKPSTNAVTQTIVNYLNNFRYCFVWRQNNIPAKGRRNTTLLGVPDICGFTRTGQALYIEIKTGNDRMSEGQKKFRDECCKRGAIYIVAKDLDDVIHHLDLLCCYVSYSFLPKK